MSDMFEGSGSALVDRCDIERELGEAVMATVYLGEAVWIVTADGERFLMVKRDSSRAPRRVRVVTDFFDELGRRFDR